MDDWEIDDKTMMTMYDEYECNASNAMGSGEDDEVEFVLKTQVEDLSRVDVPKTNADVETELEYATQLLYYHQIDQYRPN